MNNRTTQSNSNAVRNMLILSLLPIAASVQATCVTDSPEIGDIGPGSELVCRQLEDRFTSDALMVLDRTIRSPTEVTVLVSVNGAPVEMQYELIGYTWQATGTELGIADAPRAQAGLSMREGGRERR
jgi:hypothetical protein